MTEKDTKNCLSLPEIWAVDFDGTIVEDRFPEIGKPNEDVIFGLKQLQSEGVKIILWTCRTNDGPERMYLTDAVDFCRDRGLIFDAINDNIAEAKDFYGHNPRKVFANYYLDDRNFFLGEFKSTALLVRVRNMLGG